ncbi:MAG: hypothetical protein IJQ71_07930, partial [Clostridia bacterium]|nr:hypothetical protein [Clostridia bacterium]
MAETLRELVVALSLDSSNFSRNMRSINSSCSYHSLQFLIDRKTPIWYNFKVLLCRSCFHGNERRFSGHKDQAA